MATPRRSLTHLILTVLAAVLLLPLLGTSSVLAAPSLRSEQAELDALTERVANAVEDYNVARLELSQAGRKAASAQAKVTRAESALKAAQGHLGGLLSSAYMYGGADEFVQLVTTASPQTFLDRATSLDRVARNRETEISDLRIMRRQLEAAQNDAKAVMASRRAIERRLAGVRADILKQMRRQEELVSRLQTADRAARLARLAAQRRALAASRGDGRFPLYTGPATGRARAAIAAAQAQLGKPYHWGSAGPSSYDCSGLTMWAWGHAGVSLPHSSRAQYNVGRHINRAQLRPGDLVFFGSPIHHVGLYVGNGTMIEAPESGDVVKYASINRGSYVGATRVI